jgi:tetratricopeptide (TPR) repeat protein
VTEIFNQIKLQRQSERFGSPVLLDNRLPALFLLLALLSGAASVQAAKGGRPEETLVPPPPPVAYEASPGSFSLDNSQLGSPYPGFANGYSKFGNGYSGYSNAYGGFGSNYSSMDSMAAAQKAVAEAQRQYSKSLEIDLTSSDALRQRGLSRYSMGDVVGANSDLSKALSISPNDRHAAEALLDLWRRQVAANPTGVNGHLGLARAYLQIGNLEAAQAEYREVVRLDPGNPHLPVARNCVKLALARRASQKCLDAAKTLGSLGEFKDAYEKTAEALSYCPTNTQVLLYKGELCRKLANYVEAREAFVAVLKEDPKNSEALKAIKTLPATARAKPTNLVAASQRIKATNQGSDLGARRSAAATQPSIVSAFNVGGVTAAGVNSMPTTITSHSVQVSSLSNFLGSVRDLAIAQKNQTKHLEKGNKKTLQSLAINSHEPMATALENPPVLRPEVAKMDTASSSDRSSGRIKPEPSVSFGEDAQMPQLAPPIAQTLDRSTPRSSQPIVPLEPTGQTVSLELLKVAPANAGITLKVLLRNEGSQPLTIPDHLKVAIKAPGHREQLMPVRFYAKVIPAKSTARGMIKLPGSEFSPTTDIYLPGFPANGIAHRDLHLTTPLASL